MNIAFLGTKGIPNNYGGFEQFAEYLSVRLAAHGHQVTVYNPSFHPYQEMEFNGVRIVKVYSPEKLIGGAANFLYDHLCLRHALRQSYDVIYEAGYHSVAYSYKLLNVRKYKRPVLLTNMDGLEWRRSKWTPRVQGLIKKLEAIAVNESPYLISDNPGIRQYYLNHFNRNSFYIPYGADPVYEFSHETLMKYQVSENGYFILIARMEPENNVELILDAYVKARHPLPFLVIGNYDNGFGQLMFRRFSKHARFLGAVYDKSELDSLRHFSKAYFHGHSVGGTNPSLLEAMSCKCFILAHNNPFNRGVLGEEAMYFSDAKELQKHFQLLEVLRDGDINKFKEDNFQKIIHQYSWDEITLKHERLFNSLLENPDQTGDDKG